MNGKLYFDWLHFSDSHIEFIRLHENKLELLVRNVLVVDIEKHKQVGVYKKLQLKFFGVVRSVRRVIPYANDIQGSEFLAPIDICDVDEGSSDNKCFELEGVLIDPLSWIESWVIECDRAEAINNDGSILDVTNRGHI